MPDRGPRLRAGGAATRSAARRGTSTSPPARRRSRRAATRPTTWSTGAAGTPVVPATPSPSREYIYPFTDQWQQARCNPTVFTSAQRNDADAAIANLFAMHNRMHDWAFHLGFTEATWNLQAVNLGPDGLGGDAEQGRAQAGALSGSRNNANQGTPRDGLPPTTNMFLWQPIAGGAYPPCVDGDYDMTVIGHEYTPRDHQPDDRRAGLRHRLVPGRRDGRVVGRHARRGVPDRVRVPRRRARRRSSPAATSPATLRNGIRNYDMSRSPLNYSDVGYDRGRAAGARRRRDLERDEHAHPRRPSSQRYGAGHAGAAGAPAPRAGSTPNDCPGNRRWVQLVFDSFLLQAASQFSMLDMRDNMLAADLVRFGGANQDIMWNAFAESGMGVDAVSGPADTDPTPSFASPYADNATVTLRAAGRRRPAPSSGSTSATTRRGRPRSPTPTRRRRCRTPSRSCRTGSSTFVAVGAGLRAPQVHHAVPARPQPGAPAEPAAQPGLGRLGRGRLRRRRQPGPARRRHRGDQLGLARRRRRPAAHGRPGR